MKATLTLTQRMRTSHVVRWHMVRTYRQQTLAEHLALVQIVALDVVNRCYPGDDGIRLKVLEWALWHDMPEVVTGDIATPFKGMVAAKGAPTMIGEIEREVDSRFDHLFWSVGEIPMLIVTFADLFEAIHFLHGEGIGPRAVAVELHLRKRMDALIMETHRNMLPTLASAFTAMVEDMWWTADE